jgi:hypothetical protein
MGKQKKGQVKKGKNKQETTVVSKKKKGKK